MSATAPLKVGDPIWIRRSANYRRDTPPVPEQWFVTKIGRQYVYAKKEPGSWEEVKLHSDTLREYSGPNDNGHYAMQGYRIYEDWEVEVADNKVREALLAFCRSYRHQDLTIEQVRRILAIINEQL